jgi:trehalose 6-phosphate synthase/phosphatase
MSRTLIVSNRLPIQLNIEGKEVNVTPSVGGLATGLKSVHRDGDGIWIGWTGLTASETSPEIDEIIQKELEKHQCANVKLTEEDLDGYYYGFSNRTIWPLFHYFTEYAEFSDEFWEAYRRVNQKFADQVLAELKEGDTVWVQDYQLMLLPALIKKASPETPIGFFLHIPFPSYEVFRTLPYRESLLSGLLGADLIGFHTYDYERHFLSSVSRIMGNAVSLNTITVDERQVTVDSFPMGIDYERFSAFAKARKEESSSPSDLQKRLDLHQESTPDAKMILSIDRLDYTKGIANRIRAYEHFLDKYPQYIEKVRLIMLAVPSRSNVPQYQLLKKEVDELVGRINGKFATVSWTPIWYFYRSMPFENLIDLYTSCEVALITPIRDGMNLVAKEYIATRTDSSGVLILSEMAGAAKELNEALIINLNDRDMIADAIRQALEMPLEEQQSRNRFMQKRLERYNVERWAHEFMKKLDSVKVNEEFVKTRLLREHRKERVVKQYQNASKRVFFLDYDGTLRGFVSNPAEASPSERVLSFVEKLNDQENTDVVIISGRDPQSLGDWFGHLPVTLIAEHGMLKRKPGQEWKTTEATNTDWMPTIENILQTYVDRTPSTFIEYKNYSLAWHYRDADPELGKRRANELSNVIKELSSNDGVAVLNGNKVIEIKSANVHKGKAATNFVLNKDYDFIFAIGDDWTDEFMFQDLQDEAVTVKVGRSTTAAAYFIDKQEQVIDFLERFLD